MGGACSSFKGTKKPSEADVRNASGLPMGNESGGENEAASTEVTGMGRPANERDSLHEDNPNKARKVQEREEQDTSWIGEATSTDELVERAEKDGILDSQFAELKGMYNGTVGEELMPTLIQELQAKMENLREYLGADEPDLKGAREELHSLRGTSAQFGACGIVSACDSVRAYCKSADSENALSARDGLPYLERSFEVLDQLVKKYRELE